MRLVDHYFISTAWFIPIYTQKTESNSTTLYFVNGKTERYNLLEVHCTNVTSSIAISPESSVLSFPPRMPLKIR